MNIHKYLIKTLHFSYISLFFVTPLILSIKSFELFEFPKMVFVYALTAIIASAWAANVINQKKWYWKKTLLDIPLILILITQFISTATSMHPYTSWLGYYSRSHGGLLSTICYAILVWGFIQHYQKGWVRSILYASFASGSISGLYAIAEHFGIDAQYWVQDVQNRVYATLGQPNWLAAWLVALLPFTIHSHLNTPTTDKDKISDQNIFQTTANTLITINLVNLIVTYAITYFFTHKALPISGVSLFIFIMFYVVLTGFTFNFAVNAILDYKRKTTKYLNKLISLISTYTPVLLFALFTTAILYTKSRSGILAMFGALAIYILSYWGTQQFKNIKQAILKFSLPFVLAIGLTFLIGTEFTPNLKDITSTQWQPKVEKVTTQTSPPQFEGLPEHSDSIVTDSTDIRKAVWQGATIIWENNPLFGTGTETYAYSYYNYRPKEHNNNSEWDFLYNKAHNEYLNFLANNGSLGLAAILLYIILTIWLVVRNQWKKWLIIAGVIGVIKLTFYLILPDLSNTIINKLLIYPPLLKPLGISLAIAIVTLIIIKLFYKPQKEAPSPYIHAVIASLLSIVITNFYGFSVVNVAVIFFFLPAILILTQKSFKSNSFNDSPKLTVIQIIFIAVVATFGLILLTKSYQYFISDKYYNFARSYTKQGAIIEASKEIEQAIKLRPNEADYYMQKASIAAQTALTLYTRDASKSADTIKQLSEQASLSAQRSIELNPVHLNIYKNTTRVFLTLGFIDPQYYTYAMVILKRAQQLAPTDPQITINLALLNQQLKKFDEAEKYFQKTVELKPNYRRAWIYLAEMYQDIGETEKAKQTYQWILDNIDPNDQTALKALNE